MVKVSLSVSEIVARTRSSFGEASITIVSPEDCLAENLGNAAIFSANAEKVIVLSAVSAIVSVAFSTSLVDAEVVGAAASAGVDSSFTFAGSFAGAGAVLSCGLVDNQ